MGALNIPSAADIERLTRRLRSVSQRLEGIEDGVDRLDERLAALKRRGPTRALEERLAGDRGPARQARRRASARSPRRSTARPRRCRASRSASRSTSRRRAGKARKPRAKKRGLLERL